MTDCLTLNTNNYEVKTVTVDNRTICYRAFEGLCYCKAPLDAIQVLNIYIPEEYYHGNKIGLYTAETAPYFIPNTVGGYLAGPVEQPGINPRTRKANSLFAALEHGLIACSIGVRGRNSGKQSDEFFEGSSVVNHKEISSRMVGKAPAFIVDYKAGIRYLRHNKKYLPGNLERIITNGTSAGGALSALAGTSGNNPLYEPYLKEIGAADERDDIYAASCYCPIHNLEHADMAYEWQFNNEEKYYRTRHRHTENGIIDICEVGELTEEQKELSKALKDNFPSYIDTLNLISGNGEKLTLDSEGNGNFKEYIKQLIVQSAKKERKDKFISTTCAELMAVGSDIEQQSFFVEDCGEIKDINWDAYINAITRMKATPAFDAIDFSSPENEEFGDEFVEKRHFTEFSMNHNTIPSAEMADEKIIKLMNPTKMMDDNNSVVAPYWRIRHGSYDRDTSFAIPTILATKLVNKDLNVDFFLPWGMPHSGDYDLDELMNWIDRII
ncbi:subtype B tannase [uncultured Solobacterium sp.]|uniref:subtype B tannase n=1 Tax=uncultured Solobacterium sp. TaxID=747375 RepID=UPI0028EC76BE|nr:subtype B tannase [uncultured Solobacterium sp.]